MISGFLIYFFTPVTLREAHPVLEYEEQISIPPGGMDSRNISSVVLKFFCAEEADISITPTTLSLYLINESEYSKLGNLSKNIEHFRLNSSRFTLKFLPNVTYIILMKNELNENITAEYKVRVKVRILAPDLGIQPAGFYLILAGMIIFASNIFESPVNELYRKIKNFFLFKFFPEERGMPPRKDRLPMIAWLSWTSLTVFLFYLLYVQLKEVEYIILKDSLLSQLKDLFLPLLEDIFTRIVLYVSIVCAIPFFSIILCALMGFILNYFLSWFVGVRYGRVYDAALQRKVEEVAQRRILSRSSFIFYLILSVFSISIISILTRYDVDLKLASISLALLVMMPLSIFLFHNLILACRSLAKGRKLEDLKFYVTISVFSGILSLNIALGLWFLLWDSKILSYIYDNMMNKSLFIEYDLAGPFNTLKSILVTNLLHDFAEARNSIGTSVNILFALTLFFLQFTISPIKKGELKQIVQDKVKVIFFTYLSMGAFSLSTPSMIDLSYISVLATINNLLMDLLMDIYWPYALKKQEPLSGEIKQLKRSISRIKGRPEISRDIIRALRKAEKGSYIEASIIAIRVIKSLKSELSEEKSVEELSKRIFEIGYEPKPEEVIFLLRYAVDLIVKLS
jgi:hypothetical protein